VLRHNKECALMSQLRHSLPGLPGLAPPDVRYASISDQNFAAPRLVAMGHEETSRPSSHIGDPCNLI